MTPTSPDRQLRRARRMGTAGIAGGALASVALGKSAASLWPGTQTVPIDDGLSFLLLAAATLLAGWATALLALGTVELFTGTDATDPALRFGPGPGAGAPSARLRLGARVAAILLAGAGWGLLPAAASAYGAASTQQAASTQPAAFTPGLTPVHGLTSVPGTEPGLLTGSPANPAADPSPGEPVEIPVPGWTPTRADEPAGPSGEVGLVSTAGNSAGGNSSESADSVVVQRGDTLWSLAAGQLGPDATASEVAAAWPRWYAANRAVIGPDPDLIRPGQLLRVPELEDS